MIIVILTLAINCCVALSINEDCKKWVVRMDTGIQYYNVSDSLCHDDLVEVSVKIL